MMNLAFAEQDYTRITFINNSSSPITIHMNRNVNAENTDDVTDLTHSSDSHVAIDNDETLEDVELTNDTAYNDRYPPHNRYSIEIRPYVYSGHDILGMIFPGSNTVNGYVDWYQTFTLTPKNQNQNVMLRIMGGNQTGWNYKNAIMASDYFNPIRNSIKLDVDAYFGAYDDHDITNDISDEHVQGDRTMYIHNFLSANYDELGGLFSREVTVHISNPDN